MIKRTLILAALVCAMAGEMYASNIETQVVNPQPESVRILQEQVCENPLQFESNQEWRVELHVSVTIRNKTYSADVIIEVSQDTAYFDMHVSVIEGQGVQQARIVGTAPFSNGLSGSDIDAVIEGDIDDFNMEDVALILNEVITQIME